jgi:hypothetical protein
MPKVTRNVSPYATFQDTFASTSKKLVYSSSQNVQNNEFKSIFLPLPFSLIIHKTKFTQSQNMIASKTRMSAPPLNCRPQASVRLFTKKVAKSQPVITEEIPSQVKPVDSSSEKTVDISSEKTVLALERLLQ